MAEKERRIHARKHRSGTGELVNNTQSGSRLERSKVGTEEESDGYDGAFRAQVCFAGEPVCRDLP